MSIINGAMNKEWVTTGYLQPQSHWISNITTKTHVYRFTPRLIFNSEPMS